MCKVTTSTFTAKLLLLSDSENCIKLTFVVVSHIFGQAVLAPPCLLCPGRATAPLFAPQLQHCPNSHPQVEKCTQRANCRIWWGLSHAQ